MSFDPNRPRGRPAHTPGTTVLAYTPDGRRVITGGSNSAIRIYTVGQDGEPKTVDEGVDAHFSIGATNESFIMGAEDGTVWQYDIASGKMQNLLVRCALPVRDIAVSRDGKWAAVASDELTVKIVKIEDMTQVKYLREQAKGTKHVTFDPTGRYATVSATDGILYIYSLTEDEPELVRKLDGVIRRLEPDAEATSRAVWHPDGTAFASAEVTRDISIYSTSEWKKEKTFSGGHTGDITALSWAPNGTLLASAAADGQIVLWEAKTQKILQRYDFGNVINLAWHPTQNSLSFTTSDGELFIHDNFVPKDHEALLQKPLQAAPIFPGPLTEISNNVARTLTDRSKEAVQRAARARSADSLDDILGGDEEMADFVDDDDGAGYAEEELNLYGKRTNGHLDDLGGSDSKRVFSGSWQPKAHPAIQPGSTPWAGSRRYLCLNLTGAVWTVDQETHHTVTVEFYDRELHRDFHFTDPYLYDKACLNENGTLFSNSPSDGSPATIFYRPHETWTARADWRTQLPEGEMVRALALSDSYIVAVTNKDYVRVYTLFGTPFRVYRQKSQAVTCAAWRDYIMSIGNGPLGIDGRHTTLRYTVENVKRDEICQNEDEVALPEGVQLKTVFFSDTGDPCIYDSTGVLLVLQHWRTPGQARWVPLLDTKQLARLAGGRKEETYWPVAVAQEKFHCIILKGGDKNPYFPRPLLSEFDFQIPISNEPPKDPSESEEAAAERKEGARFEEAFVRSNVLLSLFRDLLSSTNATSSQRSELARKELELDKTLLQMLAVECREGEERGMKALELVTMMTDRNGKMLEAAAKVAQRYGRGVLEDKIRDLAEQRVMGMGDDDELAMPPAFSYPCTLCLCLHKPPSSLRLGRRTLTSSPRQPLAQPRHGILNEPWLPPASPIPHPTAYFSPTRTRRELGGLDGNRNNDHKPPDERVLKLGRTLCTLSPLLPTILYNTLPPEILAPSVNLHLFPSTHPHLPIVKGRTLYRAALWTVPVAWSSVPLVGNVKLQILSERIVRAGTLLDPERHGDHHDCGDERLVVRWKTEPRTESRPFHETPFSSHTDPAPSRTSAQHSHLSSSKNGTNKGLSVLLGGEEPIFKLSKEEQFTGLFIFAFDEEGRILTHTIEHADEADGWERTAKFVTLTDWLIGKARGSLDPVTNPNPELAMESCQPSGLPSHPSGYRRQRS
ncbi:hypothetical protein NUU61_002531 [Penicillium alfredii]|uniref:Minichromosome loss protein Mcl1 middle region domain-containing protein n=1 Tax=Penicillium alfredii TaxID=1506179 RepID=A0A9W9FRW9_9EURO|nr:uncharacterized protein NUU61_002531 [Penicillium alfredii]KAJ5105184.1 hypothetical protein NUU61_002531 [Penicillium alfredii]